MIDSADAARTPVDPEAEAGVVEEIAARKDERSGQGQIAGNFHRRAEVEIDREIRVIVSAIVTPVE